MATLGSVLDKLEENYPMLRGTLRDQVSKERRPFIRFFACTEDLSYVPLTTPLPEQVDPSKQSFSVVGAMSGG